MRDSTAIYTVSQKHHVAEHGGGFDEEVIRRAGAYNSGEFPPFFLSLSDAKAYREALPAYERGAIVECFLLSTAPEKQGCKARLAPGQWAGFCGETEQGAERPTYFCTECGGEFKRA